MKSVLCLFLLVALLTACGGGGTTATSRTDTPNVSYTGAAKGVYQGTANGFTIQTVVLPNDKFYSMYSTIRDNSVLVYGMIIGQGTSGSGTFTGTYTDYYYNGSTYTGTLNATFTAGQSFNATFSEVGNSPATVSATVMPTSQYDFNTSASMSNVTGSWRGYLLDENFFIITVNPDGTFTGSNSACAWSGSITPDSTHNYYAVTVTLGSPCIGAGQTATGIAIHSLRGNLVTRQLMISVNNTSVGTLFLGNPET